tara:strand:- start:2361 stop:2567 length:207 start_codon:yes stop_codon:yes gene_type:complete
MGAFLQFDLLFVFFVPNTKIQFFLLDAALKKSRFFFLWLRKTQSQHPLINFKSCLPTPAAEDLVAMPT